jgi:hypothetical protein
MLVTGDKNVDFVITLVFYVIMFCLALYYAFRFPKMTRKAIAEGKSYATEKTVRWVRAGGLFLAVFMPIAILITIFIHLTGRD